MANEYPHNFPIAANLDETTLIHSQRIKAGEAPTELSFSIAQLYAFLIAQYGLSGASIVPSPLATIPTPTGNPQGLYNSFVTASDSSHWYIDATGRSMLLKPATFYLPLGEINADKTVGATIALPDPNNFSNTQINQMLQLYSGGVRLFYPDDYDIDASTNKLIFPFDQGGERAHLLYTKLYY